MSLEDDILIEKYLNKSLSKEELTAFENRLLHDPSLQEQVNINKQLIDAINEDSWSFSSGHETEALKEYEDILNAPQLQNLKKTIDHIQDGDKETSKVIRLSNWKRYAIAASIVAIGLFSYFMLQAPSNEELYTDYLQLETLPSLVSRSDDSQLLAQGQKAFEKGSYNDAITIFNEAFLTTKESGVYLYLGISKLQLSQFDSAEKTFDDLIASDLIDAEKGYWYKALLYLKQDNTERSKEVLNKIISGDLYNVEKAKQLLKKIK